MDFRRFLETPGIVAKSIGLTTGYHTTPRQNLQTISKEGLQINRELKYFTGSQIIPPKSFYGMNPIFLSTVPELFSNNDKTGEVVLKCDIGNMIIAADIYVLESLGAEYTENTIYFQTPVKGLPEELMRADVLEDKNIIKKCIRLSKAFVCLQNIPKEKIQVNG